MQSFTLRSGVRLNSCLATLTAIFEGAKVSLENIPGLNQLKAIRTALAALAKKIGFGEKVLNYHKFLCSLTSKQSDPYLAIPVATDIASIIRMLYKIVSSEEPYIFICWGIRGAAWISAYASDVLGLSVRAIRADRTPVPVTGSYDDAKVLLEVDSVEQQCSLYLKKDLQEHFEFQASERAHRKGWSFDCTKMNFLDFCHPGVTMSESLERLSIFTALETLNEVSVLATEIPDRKMCHEQVRKAVDGSSFMGFAEADLRFIQARSLRILRYLGFQPGSIDQYKFTASKGQPTYIAHGHERDPPTMVLSREEAYDDTKYKDHARHVWDAKDSSNLRYESLYGQYKTIYGGNYINRVRYYVADPNEYGPNHLPEGTVPSYKSSFLSWPPHLQAAMTETIRHAVHFASLLAFSDWDTSLRQMSVQNLRSRPTGKEHLGTGCFEANIALIIPLCTDGINISDVENKIWTTDWLALDLDGVIVHRNTGSYHSIHDLRGKFLGFVTGRIMYDGNYCTRVRADRAGVEYPQGLGSDVDPKHFTECEPKLSFPKLSLRTLYLPFTTHFLFAWKD